MLWRRNVKLFMHRIVNFRNISRKWIGFGFVLTCYGEEISSFFLKKIVNLKNVSVWFLTRFRFLCGTHVRAILPPVANVIWHHVGRPGTVRGGPRTVKHS
jgi:hypothetical protein